MAVPNTTRYDEGPWDVTYKMQDSGTTYGFITDGPAQITQVNNTAPAIRLGGDSGYSNEARDQLVIYGFYQGGDQEIFSTGDRRHRESDGGVMLHVEERITLASQWTAIDTATTAVTAEIVEFNKSASLQYIVWAESAGLRVWDINSGTAKDQAPGGGFGDPPVHLYCNDDYVFVALGSGTDFERWDGTDGGGWATVAFKADGFGWYDETLYRWLGNQIFPATNNNGSTWGTAVDVGYDTTDITHIMESQGYLVIGKPEGLFIYDGSAVHRLIDTDVVRATTNHRGGTNYEGVLLNCRLNQIRKIGITSTTSATDADITPRMTGTVAKETYGHGIPFHGFTGAQFAYFAFDDGQNLYPELLSYNGIGWHQVYRGTSGETFNAAGYSRAQDWIVINVGSTTYRKRMLNASYYEFSDYATSGEFQTPKFDVGYPDENKAWSSLTIETDDCDANNTVTVYYALDENIDNETWTEVGSITTNGKTTLNLAGVAGQVSGKQLAFRFVLARESGDVTKTPRIKLPMIVRLSVRTLTVLAYAEQVKLDSDLALHGAYKGNKVGDSYTPAQGWDFLKVLSDTTETVIRTDHLGRISRVMMTDFGGLDQQSLDDNTEQSTSVSVRWVSVFNGVERNPDSAILNVTAAVTSTELVDEGWVYGDDYGYYTY